MHRKRLVNSNTGDGGNEDKKSFVGRGGCEKMAFSRRCI